MIEKGSPSREIWMPIKGYPNYEVSSLGEIRRTDGRVLKTYDKKGYETVYIYNSSGRKCFLVHRLVASAFLANDENLPEINHKDENPKNNRAENLEWCTSQYNSNYGHHNEKLSFANSGCKNPFFGKKHSAKTKMKMRNKKLGQPSKRKREVMINGIRYASISEAMMQLKISTRALYRLIDKEVNHV